MGFSGRMLLALALLVLGDRQAAEGMRQMMSQSHRINLSAPEPVGKEAQVERNVTGRSEAERNITGRSQAAEGAAGCASHAALAGAAVEGAGPRFDPVKLVKAYVIYE